MIVQIHSLIPATENVSYLNDYAVYLIMLVYFNNLLDNTLGNSEQTATPLNSSTTAEQGDSTGKRARRRRRKKANNQVQSGLRYR